VSTALYSYDALFYRYQREGSLRSARRVLPHVVDMLRPRSVLDVGCGAGAWLSVYRELGVADVLGVDGDYVDRDLLLVDASLFEARDVSEPFDLRRRYDLVQCLEVAEHVAAGDGAVLLDNLTRHGDRLLFSAAVPGQGGEHHVNERPYEYWRDEFVLRGYELFDFVRPVLRDLPDIDAWYRCNILFFARRSVASDLPAAVQATRVAPTARITDYSPLGLRLRKAALRALPQGAVTRLAVWKHRLFVRRLPKR
jgi:SAM-dependent methyltransferase